MLLFKSGKKLKGVIFKMGMTITEKIIANHAGVKKVSAGEVVWVDVDVLMTHDVCGPPTSAIFKREFGENAKVWDPDKIYVIPDHYIFTKDEHAKRNIEILRDFTRNQGIKHFYDPGTEFYRGVCHVTIGEDRIARPGQILIGTDSHTCTAGAFCTFATGVGNSDAAFVMGTGKLWLKVPETIKVSITGRLKHGVTAKDVILKIISDLGVNGATYKAIEFEGTVIENFSIEERMTLCNMVIEAGAKNGICVVDNKLNKYFDEKGISVDFHEKSDNDAVFCDVIEYTGEEFSSMIAMPHSPGNGRPAADNSDVLIDRAYIGSCTGGKTEDFVMAAEILINRKVKSETFAVPATTIVEQNIKNIRIQNKTVWDILIDAGVKTGQPSCAACLGGPEDTFGRVNEPLTVISTTNRNFPGRMGHKDAKIFLASPYTVAASAIKGKITDPVEFL